MPLESRTKEVILTKTKKAIEALQKSDFDGMSRLMSRLVAFSEFVTDEIWQKEFKMSAFVIGSAGATTESEFEEMEKEKKGRIIKTYTDFLNAFYEAVKEENVQKIDNVLKNWAIVFIDEIAL